MKAGAAGLSMAELTRFRAGAGDGAARPVERRRPGLQGRFRQGRPGKAAGGRSGRRVADLVGPGPVPRAVAARDRRSRRRRSAFAGIASLSEQSDGRSLIRISGAARATCWQRSARSTCIPRCFRWRGGRDLDRPHLGQSLARRRRRDGAPVFHLLVFSTFAESLWRTLLDSGAEYGVSIDDRSAWQP